MSERKRPRRDGSGRGVRANRGRSGCDETEPVGRGRDFEDWVNNCKRKWRRFWFNE